MLAGVSSGLHQVHHLVPISSEAGPDSTAYPVSAEAKCSGSHGRGVVAVEKLSGTHRHPTYSKALGRLPAEPSFQAGSRGVYTWQQDVPHAPLLLLRSNS